MSTFTETFTVPSIPVVSPMPLSMAAARFHATFAKAAFRDSENPEQFASEALQALSQIDPNSLCFLAKAVIEAPTETFGDVERKLKCAALVEYLACNLGGMGAG
jgi:hypothetical protein